MHKISFNQKQSILHFFTELGDPESVFRILIVAMVEEISWLLDFAFPPVCSSRSVYKV